MSKFKVGDNVKVVAKQDDFFDNTDWLLGQTTTVSSVSRGHWCGDGLSASKTVYRLDGSSYGYHESWLELVQDKVVSKVPVKVPQQCKTRTIHRIMYEALTPEQYKQWCDNTGAERVSHMWEQGRDKANWILQGSFSWPRSKQGSDYWKGLNVQLGGW